MAGTNDRFLEGRAHLRDRLEAALHVALPLRRWFRSKARQLVRVAIDDMVRLPATAGPPIELAIVRADFAEGAPERYVVPVVAVANPEAGPLAARLPHAVLLWLDDGALFDAGATGGAAGALLEAMHAGAAFAGVAGTVSAIDVGRWDGTGAASIARLSAAAPQLEQSNTSLLIGNEILLKIYRRLDRGENPEVEIGAALTRLAARTGKRVAPRVLGALSYGAGGESAALAIAQELIPNQGDAWRWAVDAAGRFLDGVTLASSPPSISGSWQRRVREEVPALMRAPLAGFLERVRRLGRRTADLHLALREVGQTDAAFAPTPNPADQQEMATVRARRAWATCAQELTAAFDRLPDDARVMAARVIEADKQIDDLIAFSGACPIDADHIRTHGDLHLGQVLVTGEDFVIIDFEGEPGRPLSERRSKSGAPRDAMGMVRSFAYAGAAALRARPAEERPARVAWAALFADVASAAYLGAYIDGVAGTCLLPQSPAALEAWLRFYELEKVIYEVSYELNNRPDWVEIPLRGLGAILDRA